MPEVNLTINGRQVTVPSGITVLKAAELCGIDIPTLCYDEELSSPGAVVYVVEIKICVISLV